MTKTGNMRNLIILLVIGLVAFPASRAQDEAMDTTVEEEPTQEFKVEEPAKPVYVPPKATGNTFFTEAFESEESFQNRWVLSKATKDDVDESKYDGKWSIEEPQENPLDGDLGLVLKSKAKHHAVTAKLDKPFVFKGKPFIMQYEVKFQNGQDCGGAYVKLLTKDASNNLSQFMDKTPYVIMFGPDKCGTENKLHFIFRHKHPIRGTFEEKHAKKPSGAIKDMFTDKKTHLYTLVVYPDNLFEVYVDQDMVNSGSLLNDVEPPLNPPKEITDPDDKKPEDWDEKEKIPDPSAVKPDDWDEKEPEFIADETAVQPEDWLEEELELVPDPDAEKPDDWDDDMDGEWEPPMISNPKCESVSGCGDWSPPQIKNPKFKGKWKAPMIDNPNYKGKWKARTIENPDYFEDKEPFKMTSIGAVGLELWSISNDILFDNFIITDDKGVADRWAADSWEVKHTQEIAGTGSGRSVVQAVMDATNERPWLWAVFILVVVLPIVLVIAYCCVGSSDKKEDKTAAHKKTDDPTADDESDDDVEKKEEKKEEAKEEAKEEVKEEGEERGAGDADTKKSSSTPNTPKKKPSKDDLEMDEAADADAEDEEKEAESPAATRTSPRRRKARKE